MTLDPQNRVFSQFFMISGCNTHFKSECAEIAGDRPRQPAYKISALNVDFSNPSPDPLGSRKPVRTGVKEAYPSKSGYLSAVGLSSVKMVADRHRYAA